MQLNICGPLNANEDSFIQVCIGINVMAEITVKESGFSITMGTGLEACVCIFSK